MSKINLPFNFFVKSDKLNSSDKLNDLNGSCGKELANHPNDDNPLSLDLKVGEIIDKHCQKLGLLLRPAINMCILSPPLIINKNDIDNNIKHKHHHPEQYEEIT